MTYRPAELLSKLRFYSSELSLNRLHLKSLVSFNSLSPSMAHPTGYLNLFSFSETFFAQSHLSPILSSTLSVVDANRTYEVAVNLPTPNAVFAIHGTVERLATLNRE